MQAGECKEVNLRNWNHFYSFDIFKFSFKYWGQSVDAECSAKYIVHSTLGILKIKIPTLRQLWRFQDFQL